MSIKYWEWEDAPLKEKLKTPSVREIARFYFENETKASRLAKALTEVKKRGQLRLKDCGKELPLATWKRYLDFAVTVGILKHESSSYSFTDRYSKPLKNFGEYIKRWMEVPQDENLEILFANARTQRQKKRGGRKAAAQETPQNAVEQLAQEEKKEEEKVGG